MKLRRERVFALVGVSAISNMRDSGDGDKRFVIQSVKTTNEPKKKKKRLSHQLELDQT